MIDPTIPKIYAYYQEGRTPRSPPSAVVKRCPFCGKRHTHGWDAGHRIAHCHKGTYFLVCERV
jgi:hypothetical protein